MEIIALCTFMVKTTAKSSYHPSLLLQGNCYFGLKNSIDFCMKKIKVNFIWFLNIEKHVTNCNLLSKCSNIILTSLSNEKISNCSLNNYFLFKCSYFFGYCSVNLTMLTYLVCNNHISCCNSLICMF